ncbi:group II intron reverse transcriptase/maturase [Metabacillus fastidiosus]|uniref:Group II intron reverse transcriptase/maturase n=1 Tax=Metabacillus fastidiosus TaxID=1458 RepID=A0ABU6NSZ0_9BACI|nr:group II intron reverse transcriptase/maturase [Metabacillus fastidiosus]MED4400265.1 group II intron reverse transcriptase/maturase [Metabacillus fastidiosus]
MQGIFDEFYRISANGSKLNNLMEVITSRENILLAFRNIKKNKGSTTAGVDGKTIAEFKNMNIDEFVSMIQKSFSNYTPKAVKRVDIPKHPGSNKTRPLGIPCIKDRIIQQCIFQVLEPICEAKFSDNSYGFRPNRSTEHAIASLYRKAQVYGFHYCVDIDIKGFFDNVNHAKLLKQIWSIGIRDKQLISIISKMLKAKIVHKNGSKEYPSKGTPQGGILSPLLSNIVLNELDQWIDSQWQKFPDLKEVKCQYNKKGTKIRSSEFRKLRKSTSLKEINIIRYADDFKILCKDYETAYKMDLAVKDWLKERLKLDVNPHKSKITNMRKKSTDFLGFRIKLNLKKGKFVIKSNISKKAKANIIRMLKEQIKVMQRSTLPNKDFGNYNAKVIGFHNYYNKATHISIDMGQVAFSIKRTLANRLKPKKCLDLSKKNFLMKQYGDSEQLRTAVGGRIIAPIGYCKHKHPLAKDARINKYTQSGREIIHKGLGINKYILSFLIKT